MPTAMPRASAALSLTDGRLAPILVSAGLLLAANGLLGTLVAVRANLEGFPQTLIGLMGTTYYAGFFAGCLVTPRLIQRAGHIRVFAALSAVAAIGALTLVLWIDAWLWIAVRALFGLSFSGISMVIESWLNELAGNRARGRILSLYRIVDLFAVTGGQFLLPLFGATGFDIFAVVAILFALALIPISLSRLSSPAPPESTRIRPGVIWALSPVACFGCLTIGLTNGAFRAMGPIYAQGVGLDVKQVALFMSLGIVGGALSQYPFGWLSDRVDRRWTLVLATGGAAAASIALFVLGTAGPTLIFAGAFLFGSFALPLYSLSAAHANDHAAPGQFLMLAAGLTLFYALGASLGPFLASLVIARMGPAWFFLYIAVLHGALIVFVLYRMTRREAVPEARRTRFVGLLRTSPLIFRLGRAARRREGGR